jgi:hypothetical protein
MNVRWTIGWSVGISSSPPAIGCRPPGRAIERPSDMYAHIASICPCGVPPAISLNATESPAQNAGMRVPGLMLVGSCINLLYQG